MKSYLPFLLLLVGTCAMQSCSDVDPSDVYQVSIVKPKTENVSASYRFANDTSDSLVFYSANAWDITALTDNSWITINGELSGEGMRIYRYGVTMTQNTTGEGREAYYRISDSEHSDKAYANVLYHQYATRQDGSMGSAADVMTIKGSDGSSIEISYDDYHRPTAITMTGTQTKRELAFTYSGDDVTMTENSASVTWSDTTYTSSSLTATGTFEDNWLTGISSYIYEPRLLMSLASDNQFTLNRTTDDGFSSSTSYDFASQYRVFNNDFYSYSFENGFILQTQWGPFVNAQGIYYNGNGSLVVDSLHCADSIVVAHRTPDLKTEVNRYVTTFSSVDNRMTSVDVNQLIEGVDQCDPLFLLSFFKLGRQTSVISKAEDPNGESYTVTASTNSNGSIATLVVTDSTGQSITYEFGY